MAESGLARLTRPQTPLRRAGTWIGRVFDVLLDEVFHWKLMNGQEGGTA